MTLSTLMGNPWFWPVVALLLFAALDLMVGVANDAVNFLNSAIGSKVASRKTIYFVAAGGILVGAMLGGGMLEIARKGIFNPAMLSFYDIIIVFFAAVIADIILLDLYNSLRLPTSTTVSEVFGLLGAGLAIAIIHLFQENLPVGDMIKFINASSTVSIISGIFLSVGIAFVAGWVIQTIMRAIFGFNFEKKIKQRGWLVGGIALTTITYYLLIKGLKHAPFIPTSFHSWSHEHMRTTLGILFALRSIVSILLQKIWKVHILKFITLVGTFALAAAFAGNDLVNFIGISVAGFQSVMIYLNEGASVGLGVKEFMMGGLAKNLPAPWLFLLISALIMIGTLLFSKKARAVTETEIGLTKHATGQEQFKPSPLARWMVKKTIKIHNKIIRAIKPYVATTVAKNYEDANKAHHTQGVAFDFLRASTNLVVSALLIAMATNMKLPLSTTYVTFMVAMATALADGAWGRESAVYRVSGVLTVIGSWILTAVIALTMTGLITLALRKTGMWGVGVATIGVFLFLYRSHKHVKLQEEDKILNNTDVIGMDNIQDILQYHITYVLPTTKSVLQNSIVALIQDNEKHAVKTYRDAEELTAYTKHIKFDIHNVFARLYDTIASTGPLYVQSIEALRKTSLALVSLAEQSKDYMLNKHPDLSEDQHKELDTIKHHLDSFITEGTGMVLKNKLHDIDGFDAEADKLSDHINEIKHAQLRRIKNAETGVRNTNLYIHILSDMQTIITNVQKVIHYYRRMV